MKKLIQKGSILLLLCVCFTGLLLFLSAKEPCRDVIAVLTGSKAYADKLDASGEVIAYIEKAQKKDGTTKLIVGDSVCNSLFGELQPYNPDYTILGCNKGITMAGQYLLVREYLDAHDKATDVYLVVISNSLITGFDTDFGYQYAVIPFVRTGTIDHLEAHTVKEMKNLYFAPFLDERVIDYVEASPLIKKLYLNFEKELRPTRLTLSFPDVTVEYIRKMYELCDARGVKMYLLPPPLAQTDERIEVETVLRREYESGPLYEMFPDYYDKYLYYPPELFPDGIHPNVDRSIKDDMVRAMTQKMEQPWDLKLTAE